MNALPCAPAKGDTVHIFVPVRRHLELSPATVMAVRWDSILVAINGKHRFLPPTEVTR